MTSRRVVVTGMGLVTPLGVGTEFVWESILRGKSGIGILTGPKYSKLPCRVAGLIPTEGPGKLNDNQEKTMFNFKCVVNNSNHLSLFKRNFITKGA